MTDQSPTLSHTKSAPSSPAEVADASVLTQAQAGQGDPLALPATPSGLVFCVFCGKHRDYVAVLISGTKGHCICDECLDIAAEIMAARAKKAP